MSDSPRQTVKSKLSEAEFLRLQAEKAKAEILQSLHRAQAALTHNVDPRELTRRHPLIALASAAVAGFAAATVAIPSKEESDLRRLERMHRAMNPPAPPAPAPAPATNGDARKPPERPSFGETLLHELIQLVRPVLLAAITASVKTGANPPPPPAPPTTPPQGPDKST